MKKSLILLAGVMLAALGAAAAHAGIDVSAFVSPEAAMGLAAAGGALTTKYSHEGKVIDWVNGTGSAVASGSVVKMGNVLGVALTDIAAGETGSVGFGVYRSIPKVTAAVIAQGESLTWDVSAGKFDDNAAVPASGDVTGAAAFAAEAAGNTATEMVVCFTGVPGTVTA